MIMISHDLMVAGRTDRTAVMYAGRIVESGRAEQVFDDPAHPYTRALLDAFPAGNAHRTRGCRPSRASSGWTGSTNRCEVAPRCATRRLRDVDGDAAHLDHCDRVTAGTPAGEGALNNGTAEITDLVMCIHGRERRLEASTA